MFDRRRQRREAALNRLKPLIADARAKGLWLWFPHDTWRSPDELEREDYTFLRWGPEYWQLRDPKERPAPQPPVLRERSGLRPWFIAAIAGMGMGR